MRDVKGLSDRDTKCQQKHRDGASVRVLGKILFSLICPEQMGRVFVLG